MLTIGHHPYNIYYCSFKKLFIGCMILLWLPGRMEAFKARGQLAAIDHNVHVDLLPKRKGNTFQFHRKWSRRAKTWLVSVVKQKKDYVYVPYLILLIIPQYRTGHGSLRTPRQLPKDDVRRSQHTVAKVKPEPTVTIAAHQLSRFSSTADSGSKSDQM